MDAYIFHPYDQVSYKTFTGLDHNRHLAEGKSISSKDTATREKLIPTENILVSLSFRKIGDALLALGGVKALIDFIEFRGLQKNIYYKGPHIALLLTMFPFFQPYGEGDHRDFFMISNDETEKEADILLIPEQVPVWYDPYTKDFYSPLPQRYYLYVEQMLATVLREDVRASLSGMVFRHPVPEKSLPFSLAIVHCSSMPGRKDYALTNFFALSRKIQELLQQDMNVYVIGEKQPGPLVLKKYENKDGISYTEVIGGDLLDASRFLSNMDLVIGNDTGITHLAAMSVSGNNSPQVLGLYNRHGFSKWNTGLKNHTGIGTCFSMLMSDLDLCPVREVIDERIFSTCSDLNLLPVDKIVEVCKQMTEILKIRKI